MDSTIFLTVTFFSLLIYYISAELLTEYFYNKWVNYKYDKKDNKNNNNLAINNYNKKDI